MKRLLCFHKDSSELPTSNITLFVTRSKVKWPYYYTALNQAGAPGRSKNWKKFLLITGHS